MCCFTIPLSYEFRKVCIWRRNRRTSSVWHTVSRIVSYDSPPSLPANFLPFNYGKMVNIYSPFSIVLLLVKPHACTILTIYTRCAIKSNLLSGLNPGACIIRNVALNTLYPDRLSIVRTSASGSRTSKSKSSELRQYNTIWSTAVSMTENMHDDEIGLSIGWPFSSPWIIRI